MRDKPVMVAPAMNVRMWEHAATQDNLRVLAERGVHVIGPDEGPMACGEFGMGRMTEPGAIAEAMEGAAVVHAARRLGLPGGEVRVISNSTGDRAKQQWDIARAFAAMHTLGARFDQLLQG